MAAAFGKSQRAVREFLGGTISEAVANGPLIVLLDEVETLAVDRQKLSLEANPIDVHRASDAVLAQLDHLASKHDNLLFVATSNFPQAIDEAFLSRVDLRLDIGLPTEEACDAIFRDTLKQIAIAFPAVSRILDSSDLSHVAKLGHGLDGRQIRKIILAALTFDKQTAINPERLTLDDLRAAFNQLSQKSPKEPQ